MKKILLITLLLIIGCSSKPDFANSLQVQFENERMSLKTEYKSAKNQIKKSAVFNESRRKTCDFVNAHGSNFSNWYGKIKYLITDQGGDEVAITIISDEHGLDIEYDTAGIKMGSSVYNQVTELEKGDYVYFSFTPRSAGAITSTERECFNETSWTEEGSLDAPEFSVEFSRISLNPS